MAGFLLRWLVCALGLGIASAIVPGVVIEGFWALLGASLLLGLLNAFVRPVLVILTLPITLVTLGLFLLVINAAMLGLVAAVMDSFYLSGFWAALFGALIVSFVSWLASWYVGPRGRVEVMVARR
ncbi:MAG: phage holin family protein [Pseudomonadota bacterium]|nr:phage holin family protein [Pseudomonadota bacterium]HJO36200.1 phage holin family protein [Gammaproteobacteria bacterium]